VVGRPAVNFGIPNMLGWLKRKPAPTASEPERKTEDPGGAAAAGAAAPSGDERLERLLGRLGSEANAASAASAAGGGAGAGAAVLEAPRPRPAPAPAPSPRPEPAVATAPAPPPVARSTDSGPAEDPEEALLKELFPAAPEAAAAAAAVPVIEPLAERPIAPMSPREAAAADKSAAEAAALIAEIDRIVAGEPVIAAAEAEAEAAPEPGGDQAPPVELVEIEVEAPAAAAAAVEIDEPVASEPEASTATSAEAAAAVVAAEEMPAEVEPPASPVEAEVLLPVEAEAPAAPAEAEAPAAPVEAEMPTIDAAADAAELSEVIAAPEVAALPRGEPKAVRGRRAARRADDADRSADGGTRPADGRGGFPPMLVIAVASQKGGAGKTTLAAHLAVRAGLAGQGPVVLIDTDPQGSLAEWWHARSDETPALAVVKPEQLGANLAELRSYGTAMAIIDTPPALTGSIEQVIAMADLIIIPVRPSPHDLRAAGGTVEMAHRAGKPFMFVVNGASPRASITAQAVAALSEHGRVAPVILYQRTEYAASMIDGRTVVEAAPSGRSAQEIAELWQCIYAQVGMRAAA
jgi:chromosome partitioning protein